MMAKHGVSIHVSVVTLCTFSYTWCKRFACWSGQCTDLACLRRLVDLGGAVRRNLQVQQLLQRPEQRIEVLPLQHQHVHARLGEYSRRPRLRSKHTIWLERTRYGQDMERTKFQAQAVQSSVEFRGGKRPDVSLHAACTWQAATRTCPASPFSHGSRV